MTGTVFYKMTGSGNDFIVLDGRYADPADWPAPRIVATCDRRTGAGADGLVFLTPEGPGTVRMIYLNNDGGRVDLCGNAALCCTRLAAYLEMASQEGMIIETDAGRLETRCVGRQHQAELRFPSFAVGQPIKVPLEPGEEGVYFGSVGVPHVVVVTTDASSVDVEARGSALRHHPVLGPEGANVNFVSRPAAGSGPWPIRTYERGIEGETLACGTGTVATAFALERAGLRRLPAEFVTLRGNVLAVSGKRVGEAVSEAWLCGEGRLVYTGILQ